MPGKSDKSAPTLADALARVTASHGRALRVDVILDSLGDADRATLTDWLQDAAMPVSRIEDALAAHAATTDGDVTASAGAIVTWRKHHGIS